MNRQTKILTTVAVVLAVCLLCMGGYYSYNRHRMRVEADIAAEKEAKRIDSIRAVQREQERIEAARRDSIAREEAVRREFTESLPDMKTLALKLPTARASYLRGKGYTGDFYDDEGAEESSGSFVLSKGKYSCAVGWKMNIIEDVVRVTVSGDADALNNLYVAAKSLSYYDFEARLSDKTITLKKTLTYPEWN